MSNMKGANFKYSQIFYDKYCQSRKKLHLPIDEFKRLQIGANKTHMYHLNSTERQETLKTGVKLMHPKIEITL